MRFRLNVLCVSLVVFNIAVFGQQLAPKSSNLPQRCFTRPSQLRGLPPALNLKSNQVCKPVLPGSEEGRNNLKPFHDNARYVSFDFPGFLSGITANGEVVGTYTDSNNVPHGWIRYADGTTMSFDDPSAVYATFAYGINDGGFVTGTYWDINQQFSGGHGYLGIPGGNYTTFDVPGDSGLNGTVGTAINAGGSVAGWYQDAANNQHGFLRDRSGTITTFDVPPNISMWPVAINPRDVIVGYYYDPTFTGHAFLRDTTGAVSVIDPPAGTGISTGGFGLQPQPVDINPEGRVSGSYFQPIPNNPFGGNFQGFVRHTDGSFEEFTAANYGPCCIWTYATGIAPDGTVTGSENDGYNMNHGYLRRRDGTITLFDEPNAGTGAFQGTLPIAISTNGTVLGVYYDSNDALHGFLRMP